MAIERKVPMKMPLVRLSAFFWLLAAVPAIWALDYANQGSWGATVEALRAGSKGVGFQPFDSGLLKGRAAQRTFSLDVTGLASVNLVAETPEGNGSAHSIWADAVLVDAA